MTTTAFDDQFTPSTQTILRVNVIESQQQIHDLQTRLAAAIERTEKAEAELAKLAQQKPVAWMDAEGDTYKEEPPENWCPPHVPLYAAPVPAAPYGVDDEAANRIALAVYDCKNGINPEPLLYAINRILATEAHRLSDEGQRALLQSADEVRHD